MLGDKALSIPSMIWIITIFAICLSRFIQYGTTGFQLLTPQSKNKLICKKNVLPRYSKVFVHIHRAFTIDQSEVFFILFCSIQCFHRLSIIRFDRCINPWVIGTGNVSTFLVDLCETISDLHGAAIEIVIIIQLLDNHVQSSPYVQSLRSRILSNLVHCKQNFGYLDERKLKI